MVACSRRGPGFTVQPRWSGDDEVRRRRFAPSTASSRVRRPGVVRRRGGRRALAVGRAGRARPRALRHALPRRPAPRPARSPQPRGSGPSRKALGEGGNRIGADRSGAAVRWCSWFLSPAGSGGRERAGGASCARIAQPGRASPSPISSSRVPAASPAPRIAPRIRTSQFNRLSEMPNLSRVRPSAAPRSAAGSITTTVVDRSRPPSFLSALAHARPVSPAAVAQCVPQSTRIPRVGRVGRAGSARGAANCPCGPQPTPLPRAPARVRAGDVWAVRLGRRRRRPASCPRWLTGASDCASSCPRSTPHHPQFEFPRGAVGGPQRARGRRRRARRARRPPITPALLRARE